MKGLWQLETWVDHEITALSCLIIIVPFYPYNGITYYNIEKNITLTALILVLTLTLVAGMFLVATIGMIITQKHQGDH